MTPNRKYKYRFQFSVGDHVCYKLENVTGTIQRMFGNWAEIKLDDSETVRLVMLYQLEPYANDLTINPS